jgi:thymidylate kinase
MLIEFFGLPGSGKSTMSRLVADLLLKRGLAVEEITYDLDHKRPRVERLLVKISHLLQYAATHPRYVLSGLAQVVATRQRSLLDLGKSVFNWMFIASIASRTQSSHTITLLDQGVAQALWSIRFAARQQNSLELLLAEAERAPLRPDLIICVRANFQTIGDRLAARARRVSRLDALGQDYKALQRAETHASAIMHKLRSSGIPVIEVENNDRKQLHSGARLVAGAILTTLTGQGSAVGGRPRYGKPPLAGLAESSARDDQSIEGQSPP